VAVRCYGPSLLPGTVLRVTSALPRRHGAGEATASTARLLGRHLLWSAPAWEGTSHGVGTHPGAHWGGRGERGRSHPSPWPSGGLGEEEEGSERRRVYCPRSSSPGQLSPAALPCHRITECYGWEGTFRGHLAQPPCSEQGRLQPDQVASPLHFHVLVAVRQTLASAHPCSSEQQGFQQKAPPLGWLTQLTVVLLGWLVEGALMYVTNALCICHRKLQQPVACAAHMSW